MYNVIERNKGRCIEGHRVVLLRIIYTESCGVRRCRQPVIIAVTVN